VCAAGMTGSNADDVAKELAIYRAHKAAPIAIVDEGDAHFGAALETISVPAVHPSLAFVVAAMAGHLFCYEAALAIDASALPLREARAEIEAAAGRVASDPERVLDELSTYLAVPATRYFDQLRSGGYDGTLEAATAVRLASLFRYATGVLPLDAFQIEYGKVGTPAIVVEDLTAALTKGIEELTRPVDAIKHQAKTVTVGISRSDETLLQAQLVQEVLATGAPRDGLSYRVLRTLMDLDPAVAQVIGFTHYLVDGDPEGLDARISIIDRGGLSTQLTSSVEQNPTLRGTKQTVAVEREVFVTRGRNDGRTVLIVPEVKGNQTVGIVLLHVEFVEHLEPSVARGVLHGYRHRYAALLGAVTETEPAFDDAVLGEIPTVDLLVLPISTLADRWRQRSS
jgi:glutamine---fructose-6-phosphate transaminase (isomerizing)